MLELKDYQKEAVRKLKENIVDMLGWEGMRQKIVWIMGSVLLITF